MDWANDKTLLVDLVSYASILSAAVFGMIGLFTEYKKDGKVTVWGRLAAGGIALSAGLAMTSAVLQKQIASDEQAAGQRAAAAQRAEQQARFNDQMAQLTGLNRQMAGVNRANARLTADMGRSLGAQQIQLASARRNLLLTSGLRNQEQENTFRLLRTMWADANRVPLEGVKLHVALRCAVRDGPVPSILGEDASAHIIVAPLEPVTRLVPRFELLTFGSLIGAQAGLAEQLSLINSIDRQVFFEARAEVASELTRFTAFVSDRPWRHSQPDSWRETAIEVLVTNQNARWVEEVTGLLAETPDLRIPLETFYLIPESLRGQGAPRIRVLPCDAQAELIVNGRQAAVAGGLLLRIDREHLPPELFLKFPIVSADPSLFPAFGAARSD